MTDLSPRELAALAAGVLLIDDARLYGLIEGGPDVDRARCEELLQQAREEGIVPTKDEASDAAIVVMAEIGVVRP